MYVYNIKGGSWPKWSSVQLQAFMKRLARWPVLVVINPWSKLAVWTKVRGEATRVIEDKGEVNGR